MADAEMVSGSCRSAITAGLIMYVCTEPLNLKCQMENWMIVQGFYWYVLNILLLLSTVFYIYIITSRKDHGEWNHCLSR